MEHITNSEIEQSRPTAVTLGNFDGVHMGHRRLIETTKEYAEKENLKSVVFTFSVTGKTMHSLCLQRKRKLLWRKWEWIHI